jgi:hypothetical protein
MNFNSKFNFISERMGTRTRKTNEPFPTRNPSEEKKTRIRDRRFNAAASAGEGRPREEYDTQKGQEEGEPHKEDAGARKVSCDITT